MLVKPHDQIRIKLLLVILLLISGVSGCYSGNNYQDQETPSATHSFPSVTPSSLISSTSLPKPSPSPKLTQTSLSSTVLPEPTTTPHYITHQVSEGDTLLGIALQYGKDVDDIINVNPGIDPNILTIGITISIPIDASGGASIYKPTPIPIILHQPQCYSSTLTDLTCLLLAENNQLHPVEHVTAQIIIQLQDGSQLTGEAYSPLDLIPPGEAIPLIAYFSMSGNGGLSTSGNLSSALPLPPGDFRYIDTINEINDIAIGSNQLSATVRGEITITSDPIPLQRLWILIIAYDQGGKPVGYRKLVYNNLSPDEIISYQITVYSLGPKIDRIDVLAEAKQ